MNKILLIAGIVAVCIVISVIMYLRYATYHSPSVEQPDRELNVIEKVFFPIFDLFSR